MTQRFWITTEDAPGFKDKMAEEGIGTSLVLAPGGLSARLNGWEVMFLARHYPPHTLRAEQDPERTAALEEFEPFLDDEAEEAASASEGADVAAAQTVETEEVGIHLL